MISKKKFEARASNNHPNSQYWAAGVNQSQTAFEEKALAVFDISRGCLSLCGNDYQSREQINRSHSVS